MSHVVEDRIVEMRFDNDNFEKNVNTSIHTLDKLKKSLNLEASAKGLESIQHTASNINLEIIAKSAQSLSRRFSTLGLIGATNVVRLTTQVQNLAGKMVAFAKNKVITGGMNRAFNLEKARFQLRGLIGDVKDASKQVDAIMEDVDYGVSGTAYSLDSAAVVASQLAASGIKAGDGMKAALRGVSGVAAMTHSTYDDIGAIYTKIAGNGRLYTAQLNQLSIRGINAAATLAKELGTTEDEVRKMTKQGQIDFKMFATAMDNAFGEHAKKANDSFQGAISNIGSAFARIGELFYAPLIKDGGPLVELFNTIRVKVNSVKTALVPIANVVTGTLNKIVKKVNAFVSKFTLDSKWKQITDILTGAGIDVEKFQKRLVKLGSTKIPGLKTLIKDAGGFEKSLNKGWLTTDLFSKALKKTAKEAKGVEDMTAKLKYFQEVVDKVWYGSYKNGKDRVTLLTKAGYDYAEVQALVNKTVDHHRLTLEDLNAKQLKSIGYTDKEIKAIKKLAKQAKTTGTTLNGLITSLENPGPAVRTFNGLQNILKGMKQRAEIVKNAFADMVSHLNIKVKPTIDKIALAFEKLSEKTILTEDSTSKLQRIFNGLFAIFNIVVLVLGDVFELLKDLANIIRGKFNPSIETTNKDFLEMAASAGDAVVAFREWLETNNIITTAFKSIAGFIDTVVTGIKKFVSSVMEIPVVQEAVTLLSKAIERVVEAAKALGGKALNNINAFVNKLKEADNITLSGIVNGIKDLAKNIGSAVKERDWKKLSESIPKNVILGFVDGIREGGKGAFSAIASFANKIIETLCNVLGIHSPSLRAAIAGKFTVEGFVEGMKQAFPEVFRVLKAFGDKLVDTISSLNTGNIFVFAVSFGLFKLAKEMIAALGELSKPINTFKDVIGNFVAIEASIKKLVDTMSSSLQGISDGITKANLKRANAEVIKSLALAVISIAASMFIISKIPEPMMYKSAAILAGFMLILAGILKYGAQLKPEAFHDIGTVFASIALAFIAAAIAMKMIGKMDPESYLQGLVAIGSILVMVMIIAAICRGKETLIYGLEEVFKGIGIAMIAVAVSMRMIGKMEQDDVDKAVKAVLTLMGFMFLCAAFIAFVTSEKGIDANISKIGNLFLKLSASMIIMAVAIRIIGNMKEDQFNKATTMLGGVAAFITILVGMGTIVPEMLKSVDKLGTMFAKLALSFLILVIAFKIIGRLSIGEIMTGLGTLAAVIIGFSWMSKQVKSNGVNADRLAQMFGKIGIAFLAISVAFKILATMRWQDIGKGLLVFALVGGIFTAMSHLVKDGGENADKLGTLFLKMSISLFAVALCIAILSVLDPKAAASGTAAMVAVLVAYAFIIQSCKDVGSDDKAVAALTRIVVLVGILTAGVVLLALLPIEKTVTAAGMMAGLMVALGYMLKSASGFKMDVKPFVMILVIIGVLAGIMYLLRDLPVETTIANAVGLSLMLLALGKSVQFLGAAKDVSKTALIACGVLLLVMAGMAAILYLLNGIDPKGAFVNAVALSVMLIALTTAVVILSFAKSVSATAMVAAVLLTAVMAGLAGILYLMKDLPAEDGIAHAKALSMLILSLSASCILLGIAGLFGAAGLVGIGILAALIAAVGGILYTLGSMNSDMQNAITNGIPMLSKIGEGLGKFFGSIITGFTEGIEGAGESLTRFMDGLSGFIEGSKKIDGSAVQGVENLGKILGVMGKSNIKDQIKTSLGFGTSMSEYVETDLIPFANSLVEFSDIVKNVTWDKVEAAGTAGTMVATMMDSLPNMESDVSAFFNGGSNTDKFGTGLISLGEILVQFSDIIAGIPDDVVAKVDSVVAVLNTLTTSIPDMGGLWTQLTGGSDMEKFGPALLYLVKHVKAFGEASADINTEAVSGALACINKLIILFKKMDGVSSDPATGFAKALHTLADTGIANFTNAMSSGEGEAKEAIRNFIDACAQTMQEKTDKWNSAINKLANTDTKGTVKQAKNNIKSISGSITKSLSSATKSTNAAAKDLTDGAVKELKGHSDYTDAGSEAGKAYAKGIEKALSKVKSAAKSLGSAGAKRGREARSDFKSSGEYAAQGYAIGIKNKKASVVAAAAAVAKAAHDKLKSVNGEGSPAKEYIKSGAWATEGYAIGLTKRIGLVTNATRKVGREAYNTMVASLSDLSERIQNGIESDPIITPVLDLSNVESGVSAIDKLMLGSAYYSMNNGANAINSRISRDSTNTDLLNAIRDLKNSDGSIGDTYIVNGITYDDGSNISGAVQELVRAARVERRS